MCVTVTVPSAPEIHAARASAGLCLHQVVACRCQYCNQLAALSRSGLYLISFKRADRYCSPLSGVMIAALICRLRACCIAMELARARGDVAGNLNPIKV